MWQAITVIEAQEQLKMFDALDWPNLKKNERQKKHKNLSKLAFPNDIIQKKYITAQDLQRVLGR